MKWSSLQPSSVFLLIRSKRFFLPDCRPTHASGTARRQLNNQTSHQTHSALPEWQRRGERRWEKNKAMEPRMQGKVAGRGEGSGQSFSALLAPPGWAGGGGWRRAGSARLSSPSKIYLGERGFTRSAWHRGSRGEKVFFSSTSSLLSDKDEEKSFKLLVARQREG